MQKSRLLACPLARGRALGASAPWRRRRGQPDYQLFVPRELASDLAALTGLVMRQREDKGSSLRFEAADAASQKLRAALEKGREVLTAAQAERARLRQIEELKRRPKN